MKFDKDCKYTVELSEPEFFILRAIVRHVHFNEIPRAIYKKFFDEQDVEIRNFVKRFVEQSDYY